MKKQIIVILEVEGDDSDITSDDIEHDLRMGEDQIGYYIDYTIKNIEII